MERDTLVNMVTEAQAGSRKAISDLFNNFQSVVYGIAMREIKDPETAADVTQETFIEVIQTIDKLQEPAAFVSWLKTITYHQCTRYYRKKETKHEKLLEERDDAPVLFDTLEEENEDFIPDKALENEELCQIIRSFIEQLPDAQRSAIMMKYFDELSVKEIAAVQGVSENTVLSRLYYGRNAIKAEVEEYEEKHGIKLHAIPFFPLFRLLFPEAGKSMSIKASVAAAKAISTATGVKVTASGAGIAATVAAWPIAAKVGAGIAATVVTISAPIIIYNTVTPPDAHPADNDIAQTTSAEGSGGSTTTITGNTFNNMPVGSSTTSTMFGADTTLTSNEDTTISSADASDTTTTSRSDTTIDGNGQSTSASGTTNTIAPSATSSETEQSTTTSTTTSESTTTTEDTGDRPYDDPELEWE